ncbi:hypothetical protein D3C72_2480700 [compost metagenome]
MSDYRGADLCGGVAFDVSSGTESTPSRAGSRSDLTETVIPNADTKMPGAMPGIFL